MKNTEPVCVGPPHYISRIDSEHVQYSKDEVHSRGNIPVYMLISVF